MTEDGALETAPAPEIVEVLAYEGRDYQHVYKLIGRQGVTLTLTIDVKRRRSLAATASILGAAITLLNDLSEDP